MVTNKEKLLQVLGEYQQLGIADQVDYDKFYLYSLITHSTAIEGSTVTEVENQLLFDEGISAKGRSIGEQMMNLDLKKAYEYSMRQADLHVDLNVDMLKTLSALVMKNTGSEYNTLSGSFDSSKGDLRLVNVTAGVGGSSYMNFQKVPSRLEDFCQQINERRKLLWNSKDIFEKYILSFDAHFLLVTIHPWVDGNGRMSRLIMNHLQFEMGLLPSKVKQEDKSAYIQALIDSREQESPEPFRRFMMETHIRNLRNEIAQFRKTNEFDPLDHWKEVQNEPQDRLNEPQETAFEPQDNQSIESIIVDMIRKNNKVTREEIASATGKSVSTIKRRLKDMHDRVYFVGSGYSGHWVVKE